MTILLEHIEDPSNPGYALGEDCITPVAYAISTDMTFTIKHTEDAIRLDMRDVYRGIANETNSDGINTKYKVSYAGFDENEFGDEELLLGSLKLKLVGAPDGLT